MSVIHVTDKGQAAIAERFVRRAVRKEASDGMAFASDGSIVYDRPQSPTTTIRPSRCTKISLAPKLVRAVISHNASTLTELWIECAVGPVASQHPAGLIIARHYDLPARAPCRRTASRRCRGVVTSREVQCPLPLGRGDRADRASAPPAPARSWPRADRLPDCVARLKLRPPPQPGSTTTHAATAVSNRHRTRRLSPQIDADARLPYPEQTTRPMGPMERSGHR